MADAIVTTKIDNGILTVECGAVAVVIDPSQLPRALVEYAALHGFKQAIVDAAALGKGATIAEKGDAIQAKMTRWVESGEWASRGAGDGTSGDGLLVRAIMEVCGLDRDAARTQVGEWDKKTQAAMRADPSIAPVIARLRVEKVAKAPAVDTASILAGLRTA